MEKTKLSSFNNYGFNGGAGACKRALWFLVSAILFYSPLPGSFWKRIILKIFGAKIGRGVVIKPWVNIKYPWNLKIGNFSWIGEQVWIDNLAPIEIQENCCVSQGAMLLTGNHNYKKETFDLMIKPIVLEEGVWIGAKSVVGPGVSCKSHSVLSVGSVTSKDLEKYTIYIGNPAVAVRERVIN
jgi:putative colanic acid biosynthesis acetyltransferase WcaF